MAWLKKIEKKEKLIDVCCFTRLSFFFSAVNTVFSSSENRTFQFATAVGEGSPLSRSHFAIWTRPKILEICHIVQVGNRCFGFWKSELLEVLSKKNSAWVLVRVREIFLLQQLDERQNPDSENQHFYWLSMCLRNPVTMQNFASQLCYGSARRLFCFAVVRYCEWQNKASQLFWGLFI